MRYPPRSSRGISLYIPRILVRHCGACHNLQDLQGGLDLAPDHAYASLVGQPSKESPLRLVAPGNADASYISRKRTGTHLAAGGIGQTMPLNGQPLAQAEIDTSR